MCQQKPSVPCGTARQELSPSDGIPWVKDSFLKLFGKHICVLLKLQITSASEIEALLVN